MKTIKWYQYTLAILTIIFMPFLIALAVGVVASISRWISAYAMSNFYINIFASIAGCVGSMEISENILGKQKPMLILVFSIILATLWSLVALLTIRYSVKPFIVQAVRVASYVCIAIDKYNDIKNA